MIKFKLFQTFNIRSFLIIFLVCLSFLLLLLFNKSYLIDLSNSPSLKPKLINIAKVAVPFKNFILMRNIDDKIALFSSSGSCIFCNLSKGNFKNEIERDMKLMGCNKISDLCRENLRYRNN